MTALDAAHQRIQRNNSGKHLDINDQEMSTRDVAELHDMMKELGFPNHIMHPENAGSHGMVSMPPIPPNGNSNKRSHPKNGARPKSLASNVQNLNTPPHLSHSGSSPQIHHHVAQRHPIKTSPSTPAMLMHLDHSPHHHMNLISNPIPEDPPERPPPPKSMEKLYKDNQALSAKIGTRPLMYGYTNDGHGIPFHLEPEMYRRGIHKQMSLPEGREHSNTATGGKPAGNAYINYDYGAMSKIQYIPNIPVNHTHDQQPMRKETPKLSNIPQYSNNSPSHSAKGSSNSKSGLSKGGHAKTSSAKGKRRSEETSPPPLPPPPVEEYLPPTPPVRKESTRLIAPLRATSIQSNTAHINGVPGSPVNEGGDHLLNISHNSAFSPVSPHASPQRKPKQVETGVVKPIPKTVPNQAPSKATHVKPSNQPKSLSSPQSVRSEGSKDHLRRPMDNSPMRNKNEDVKSTKPPLEPSHSKQSSDTDTDTDYGAAAPRRGRNRPPAPPFQVKRRQRINPPPRLCRSLDYIPSDVDDNASSVSSRAESPTAPKFPILDPENFMPLTTLVKQLADNISISSMGSGMSSEMSRSDSNLNYDSGSAAYESEYDNYRPGMASDEDYFVPEPISDIDLDMFDDINIDNVTISDTYSLDMPKSFMGAHKKITDV